MGSRGWFIADHFFDDHYAWHGVFFYLILQKAEHFQLNPG